MKRDDDVMERDELDELLCFDLYAASRAVTAAYRPILERHGLTYPQYLVLTVLWARGSRPIHQLADRLRLDHATLTPLLRRMEAAGLVDRVRSSTDERSVIVQTTALGARLGEHASDIQCQIAEAMGVSEGQQQLLQDMLRTVERHARSAAGPGAHRPQPAGVGG